MFNKLIESLFGTKTQRDVQQMQPIVEEINHHYERLNELSDEALTGKTDEFKKRIAEYVAETRNEIEDLQKQLRSDAEESDADFYDIRQKVETLEKTEHEQTQEILKDILPEAFAVVKETCRRFVGKTWKVVGQDVTWDMIPYDVQLIGGIVQHEGKISEMATGEGKTLVATMPIYLNALVGKGVHLITVNDYLARRDCEWMGEIFKFLGLTVSFITNDMSPPQRREAYLADITYGTNNEFGFDYLRDNMAISPEGLVQRGHHYAIIDEVDSVLIDEARTPLIISGPVGESKNKFAEMKPHVQKLVRSQTNLVNQLVSEGEKLLKEEKEYEAGIKFLTAQRGSPKHKRLIKLSHESGVQRLIRRVESDFMRDKKLNELDDELYYAIDEKAHTIDMTDKGRQHISPGNEDMFVLPDLATELSRIEGDEALSLAEREKMKDTLQSEYSEKSERLHNISQLLRAFSLFEKDVEYVVSDDGKVMIVDEFTGRLMPGRRFSDGLHQALEAKENVKIERETQTMATITLQNFFRLYSKLAGMTGTAETEAGEFWEIYKLDVVVIPTNEPIRRYDNDDLVYRTKREKYNAIIDEIERLNEDKLPVLVGTITVDVSETLSRMLKRRGIRHNVLNAKQNKSEAEIVSYAGEPGSVTIATNMAGRGTDIKLGQGVIRSIDEDLEDLVKDAIKVSNQKTVFIHEITQDTQSRITSLLDKEKADYSIVQTESEKLQLLSSESAPDHQIYIVPKSIAAYADTRGENSQFVHMKIRDYSEGGLQIIGTERHESRRIDRQLRGRAGRQGDPGASRFFLSLEDDLMRLFAPERIIGVMDRLGVEEGEVISHPMITKSIERAQKRVENRNFEIRKHLLEYDDVMNKQREVIYERRKRALEGENLNQEIEGMIISYVQGSVDQYLQGDYGDSWNWDGLREDMLKTLLVPLPVSEEEKSTIQKEDLENQLIDKAIDNLKKKREALGSDLMAQLERFATLKTIDDRWKEHLYEMDQLKEGIGLRAYGQKDPLLEYKHEGYRTFSEMLERIDSEILDITFKAQVQVERMPDETLRASLRRDPIEMAAVHENTDGMGFSSPAQPQTAGGPPQAGKKQPVKVEHKVGRNEPCPCGSGKKFKHCHGVGQ